MPGKLCLHLNPWWYPHDLYAPKDAQSGGPFTIGRVIHSSRSVGFTGWIGGVAVFDRALSAEDLGRLFKVAAALAAVYRDGSALAAATLIIKSQSDTFSFHGSPEANGAFAWAVCKT
jgi:hypothetical protein